jgi:hypothetical protein
VIESARVFLTSPASMRSYLLAVLLLGFTATSVAQSPQREKLAEGEFQFVPAPQMTKPSQSWTLWRERDGRFYVEDHFSFFEDPGLMVLATVGHLSKELQREVADKVGQTELEVTFNSDWKAESLVLRGVRVSDGHPVDVAKCRIDETEIACKGLSHGAKLKKDASQDLLFSFPFPLLVRNLALRAKHDPNHEATVTLVELRIGKNGLELLPSQAKVSYDGDEVLSIGEQRFNARKYKIERTTSKTTLSTIVWLSGNDVVLAVQNQDPNFVGSRVLMSRFKKYSDF